MITARRTFRFVAGVTVAAAVLLFTACDWPQARYGPDQSGFNPTETAIGPANVGTLVRAWTATVVTQSTSPAVANGVAYVGSDQAKLYAFDAAGIKNCSGTPKTCTPLWTAPTGGAVQSSPTVANGVVYVGSDDGKLYAFDAAGIKNCSGTPKTCTPLWTAPTGGLVELSPTVANGVVYVGSDDGKLYAFDAGGVTNCSGIPKTCTALWTATPAIGVFDDVSDPAVSNGVVYVGTFGNLHAFDAAGVTNCSGTPKTCTPLWTASIGDAGGTPAVANGLVYFIGGGRNFPEVAYGKLYAFDAGGVTNCSGIPKTCAPLWTATTAELVGTSPAVANGVIYVGSLDHKLYAFDALGTKNCSGIPKTCTPLWTATTDGQVASSPAVANGVVYVGGYGTGPNAWLYAFDAAGSIGCSGVPKTCTPLWLGPTGGQIAMFAPVVANGVVYVGSNETNKLTAFHLP